MDFFIKTFGELTKEELYEILRSRAEIFVKEQKMNCIDPDGRDMECFHVFSMEDGRITSYLRAFKDGLKTVKIGRVLTLVHNRGTGTKLMNFLIKTLPAKTRCTKIILDAQKQAVPFYEKLGFKITSEEYIEEGIIHVDMEKDI